MVFLKCNVESAMQNFELLSVVLTLSPESQGVSIKWFSRKFKRKFQFSMFSLLTEQLPAKKSV